MNNHWEALVTEPVETGLDKLVRIVGIGKYIAWVYNIEDARLIAQAPNLLKIAEMVERVIQLGNVTEDSDEALEQWFEAQEELGELVMETLKEVRR